MAALLSFQTVSKWFSHHSGRELLRSHFLRWFSEGQTERLYALNRVSFEVQRGESLGIVGRNGAGKSTLLSLIAGLAIPNEGRVEVNGRVAALLELGSGFHPDLSGAENLMLNAALLGLNRARALRLFDKIVDFSGIGEFINDPLRTYSSGMTMRLAFSIAIHTDPDILLIDEVLAVGDSAFQSKCVDVLEQMRRAGTTLIFVSHAAGAVQQMCDRALWIDHGEVVMEGAVQSVLEGYEGRTTLEPQV